MRILRVSEPIFRRQDTTAVKRTFSTGCYDHASQLTAVQNGSATTESHTYDANGNRTTGGATTSDNRLLFDGTWHYAYDNNGNRTEKYQLSGSTQINVTTYTYDNRNRLTSITTPNGEVITYQYDAFNRETSKTVTPSGGASSEEWYIYDGQNLLMVLNDASGDVAAQFLYGPLVDQVLAEEDLVNGDTINWLLGDNQGTIRDVVTYNATSGTTSLVDHLVYDAFGNLVSQTNSAFQPQFLFQGMRYDADASLYYDNARWYDPVTGRFMTQDPTGFAAGDPNWYRFVGNDVTNAIDPSGLKHGQGSANGGRQPMNGAGGVGVKGGGGYSGGSGGSSVPVRSGSPQSSRPDRGWYNPAGLWTWVWTGSWNAAANEVEDAVAEAGALRNAGFLYDFVFGCGPNKRVYGQNSPETRSMMGSPGAAALRQWFNDNAGETNGQAYDYGSLRAALDSGPQWPPNWDDTAMQVGGFGNATAINNGDGTVTYTIPNAASANSFFYHGLPNNSSTTGPFSTIYQTFQWTEQVNPSQFNYAPDQPPLSPNGYYERFPEAEPDY